MKEGWPNREREEDTHKILVFDGPAHIGGLFTGEVMKMLIHTSRKRKDIYVSCMDWISSTYTRPMEYGNKEHLPNSALGTVISF